MNTKLISLFADIIGNQARVACARMGDIHTDAIHTYPWLGEKTAAEARKHAYSNGRYLLNAITTDWTGQLLHRAINRHPDGFPEFQDQQNLKGSISHSGAFAMAGVTAHPMLIGVDCQIEVKPERWGKVSRKIYSTNSEQQHVAPIVAFSLKEAIFKAYYPAILTWFYFDAVELELVSENLYRFHFLKDVACVRKGEKGEGHIHWHEGHCFSLVIAKAAKA